MTTLMRTNSLEGTKLWDHTSLNACLTGLELGVGFRLNVDGKHPGATAKKNKIRKAISPCQDPNKDRKTRMCVCMDPLLNN